MSSMFAFAASSLAGTRTIGSMIGGTLGLGPGGG
jgi:hypothetical protein